MNSKAAMEQERSRAEDEVRAAEDKYESVKEGPERIEALREIRDAKQRLLEVTRRQATVYGNWNGNLMAAVELIEERRLQNNV